MNSHFPGMLLKKKRLEREWSQEGLAKGICTVSYLSKIEQGKALASDEILKLLFARLDTVWHDGPDALYAEGLANALYDAVFSMEEKNINSVMEEFYAHKDICLDGPFMLDFLLLEQFTEQVEHKELAAFTEVFDSRQMSLWLLWKEEPGRALLLLPCAFTYEKAGCHEYVCGNYARAVELLTHSFHLAAKDCLVHIMLLCRLLIGNCYSDSNNYDQMLTHYQAAKRLAKALGEENTLFDIEYNIASTAVQLGRYKEGYSYFNSLDKKTVMCLHKLAVCCEALGKKEEALAALKEAEHTPGDIPDRALSMKMCALVSYRLLHEDYLHSEEYGSLLLSCFMETKKELPKGYAIFHLPWLEEWYKENRQYKQAYELLKNFPAQEY